MGQQETVASVTTDQLRADDFFPDFSVGDTINVHYTIVEDIIGLHARGTKSW